MKKHSNKKSTHFSVRIATLFLSLTSLSAYCQYTPLLTTTNLNGVNVSAKYTPPTPMVDPSQTNGASITNLSSVNVSAHSGSGNKYSPNNSTAAAIPTMDKNGCPDFKLDPIELSFGAKVDSTTYFKLPGEMGLSYSLYYNSSRNSTSAVAPWADNLSYKLDTICNGAETCTSITLNRPDGSSILFKGRADGTNRIHTESGGGNLATLVQNADNTYTLQDEDSTTQVYSQSGQLISIKDASGIGWTLTYSSNSAAQTSTTQVTHTNGQSFTISSQSYISNGVYTTQETLTDPGQNAYVFVYGPNGLISASLPGSPSTVFAYKYAPGANVNGGLNEVDINSVPYAYTTYDASLRANGTHLADNSQTSSIIYSTNSTGLVAALTNPLGHTTSNQYNALNQLVSVSDNAVSDCGATVNSRQYDGNGNLQQTVDNNGNVHTYTYAVNGQLQTETEASGTTQARTTDYVWDPNQQLNRLTSVTVEGWSKTAYTYNAQNRLASVALTNLSANGTANQTLTTTYNYTLYGNGMVQTLSVTHPSPNNSDTDVSTYDALGNLSTFADGLGHTTTYSNYNGLNEVQHVVGPNGDATDYTYDARGRIATKTTYPYGIAGTWTYTYDGFGLLYTLTTPDNEVTTWNRNAEMMVQTITHNDKDGTSTETFGYDPNGDVTSHVVTRGSDVGLSETAQYDALGRLYQKIGNNGQTLTYGYDGNGNVVSTTNAAGHVTTNQYDHLDRVSQTTETGGASPPMPTAAPTLTVPATNASGAYTVTWTTVSGATRYILQEQASGGGGGAITVANSTATSWSTSGRANGTYAYQVKACNSTGCGPLSAASSVTVNVPSPPTSAPSLTVPASSATGSYSVTWTSIANTSSYTLQERLNGGSWTTVQSAAVLSWNPVGRANGSYGYQVQACNAVGCGPWSAVGTITVSLPPVPSAAPALTVPAANATGGYSVSWGTVSGAATYIVQQQVNGGGWTTLQNSASTSVAVSGETNGSYGYRVQGCNISGCGPNSATGTTVVTFAPTGSPSLTAPSNSATGSYTVSWSGVAGASTYLLQQQVNGGSFTAVQNSAATSWAASGETNGSYGYRVQACNAGGCGPVSGVSTVLVTQAPASPGGVTAPSYVHGVQYYVTWTAAATATSYNVQRTNAITGATALAYTTSGTSVTIAAPGASQTLQYAVQACNASGCSAYANAPNTTETDPPGPIN